MQLSHGTNRTSKRRRAGGPGRCGAVRRGHTAGETAARRGQPVDARRTALPRVGARAGHLPAHRAKGPGAPESWRAPPVGRGNRVRGCARPGAADVRAVRYARHRGIAPAERRRRVHRPAGLVRVPGERRSPHCARDDLDHRRGRCAEHPDRRRVGAGLAVAGDPRRLPVLGNRQQPHP